MTLSCTYITKKVNTHGTIKKVARLALHITSYTSTHVWNVTYGCTVNLVVLFPSENGCVKVSISILVYVVYTT
jgi:hypothetical protein